MRSGSEGRSSSECTWKQPPSGGEGPHRALQLHVVRNRSGTGAADQKDAMR